MYLIHLFSSLSLSLTVFYRQFTVAHEQTFSYTLFVNNMSYRHQRHISIKLSMSTMPPCFMETEPFCPLDEHNELITALLAGRWWAIMEVEDLLRSSFEKNECGLISGQWEIVEAPQGTPVPDRHQQGEPVPAQSPVGAPKSDGYPQGAPVPARPPFRGKLRIPKKMRQHLTRDVVLTPLPLRSPKGPPTLAGTPKGEPVPTTSPEEAPVPA